MKINRRWLALVALAAIAAAAFAAASAGGLQAGPSASTAAPSGSITVWVDAVRLPVAKLYAKTHPKVHLNIVTYDGDGNGSTTMQTKIQLWNRTGNGWPDVIFTEQANDPVWMSQKPFDYAMDLKTVFPANLLKRLARTRRSRSAPSTVAWSASRTTWPRRCSTSTRS